MRAGVQTVLRIGVCTGCPISDFAILILSVLLTEKCFGSNENEESILHSIIQSFWSEQIYQRYLNGICSPKYVLHDIRISSKLIISTRIVLLFIQLKKTKVTRSRNNSTFIQNIFFASYCAQDVSSLILTFFLSEKCFKRKSNKRRKEYIIFLTN